MWLSEMGEILLLVFENKILEIFDEVYIPQKNSYDFLLSKIVLEILRLFFDRFINIYKCMAIFSTVTALETPIQVLIRLCSYSAYGRRNQSSVFALKKIRTYPSLMAFSLKLLIRYRSKTTQKL